ncbi:uncharacterized protein N7483_006198 [Penicillium malachiteum]|uniref:uncharacterized protein n=1 Tax=Penicillium malachiteum TaxID=1324776 RepID=UPI00254705BE|nr:uncharacterized protein N7483_006198 [Penicillium malachiteum]KAJ5731690.1 hypothetical protein N7483_006198 [Penicillium malachiteum]
MRSDVVIRDYLYTSEWQPRVIEAFLWKVMVGHIFDKFWWADINPRAMSEIYDDLERRTAAEIQTFQMWSATTTKMIRDSQKHGDGPSIRRHARDLENVMWKIYESIADYSISTKASLTKDIYEILDAVIALDKELSQPLARFEWDFPSPEWEFDPSWMHLGAGETTTEGAVSIVLFPGITKRGQAGNSDQCDFLVDIK